MLTPSTPFDAAEEARKLIHQYRSDLMRQNMQHDLMTLEAYLVPLLKSSFQKGREVEQDKILKQIEFCGFGAMEWRMKLIGKLRAKEEG